MRFMKHMSRNYSAVSSCQVSFNAFGQYQGKTEKRSKVKPQHLHRAIAHSNARQRIYPQPPTPTPKAVTPVEPMTNGYDERDKDELVMHSRAQHPFKTVSQIKSALSGQKRGF
jgi:hypothetical protein